MLIMKEIIVFLITIWAPMLIAMELIPESRMYGGYYADDNQFPYQISLQKDGHHKCGGVILTKSFVLTAGHCVTDTKRYIESPSSYIVVAGTVSLNEEGWNYEPDDFIVHEKYPCCNKDIALIHISKQFDWNESIKPIRIYEQELEKDSIVTITGWGYYNKNRRLSEFLKFDHFLVSSSEDCKRTLRNKYYKGLLCLNHTKHHGACSGDSGGPATFQDQLVGIASFVFVPCGRDKPDGYIKVFYYLDWINDKISYDVEN